MENNKSVSQEFVKRLFSAVEEIGGIPEASRKIGVSYTSKKDGFLVSQSLQAVIL